MEIKEKSNKFSKKSLYNVTFPSPKPFVLQIVLSWVWFNF